MFHTLYKEKQKGNIQDALNFDNNPLILPNSSISSLKLFM